MALPKYDYNIDFYVENEKYELAGYYDGEQFEVYHESSTINGRCLSEAEYKLFNEFIDNEIIACIEEQKKQAELDRRINSRN